MLSCKTVVCLGVVVGDVGGDFLRFFLVMTSNHSSSLSSGSSVLRFGFDGLHASKNSFSSNSISVAKRKSGSFSFKYGKAVELALIASFAGVGIPCIRWKWNDCQIILLR